MKKVFLLFILLLNIVQYTQAQNFKVVAYLPDYRWSNLTSIDYSKTTHVLAAFGNPDSSGALSFSQNIDAFATAVHNGGAKAMLSLGGGGDYSWGNEYHTYEYLFTNTNRTPFVMKVMDYVRAHQLDGIDLDIEGYALQLANYNLFAQELADSLHLEGLTIGGAYVGGSWANYISAATVAKLDFITTQSYGGLGDWNWNHPSDQATFTLFENDITFWKNKGFSADQVIGGLPFFAVEFPPSIQPYYWPYQPTLCSIYTGAQFSAQHPLENDLVYASNGDPVYINSLKTFKKKINYAVNNAGGIMIWEIGGDCYSGSLNILDSLSAYVSTAPLVVKNKQSLAPLKFYPNPANTQIKIESIPSLLQHCTVLDLFGKEVLNSSLENSWIDVTGLDPGMYFIRFTKGENSSVPAPLMIQR